uniref:Phlebovirus glycoprotein G2 fusion domain-containing protein n=1 Tax=Parastrongyloides trichosuri TaxID=131310 RepID=A0A0N4Z9N1_PARTI
MKREEKSPINDNIIKDLNYYNKNEHIEGTNDQEQSNISQNLLFTNSVLSNQSTKLKKLSRRSISNAVIESAHCEHIELIECDSYETNDMKCLITATGMPCCVCTGRLKSLRKVKKWIVW